MDTLIDKLIQDLTRTINTARETYMRKHRLSEKDDCEVVGSAFEVILEGIKMREQELIDEDETQE